MVAELVNQQNSRSPMNGEVPKTHHQTQQNHHSSNNLQQIDTIMSSSPKACHFTNGKY